MDGTEDKYRYFGMDRSGDWVDRTAINILQLKHTLTVVRHVRLAHFDKTFNDTNRQIPYSLMFTEVVWFKASDFPCRGYALRATNTRDWVQKERNKDEAAEEAARSLDIIKGLALNKSWLSFISLQTNIIVLCFSLEEKLSGLSAHLSFSDSAESFDAG